MDNSLNQTLSTLAPIILAVVGIFSGTGYWAWRAKRVEQDTAEANVVVTNSKTNAELVAKMAQLLEKIDELNETREQLVRDLYEVKLQLGKAEQEIQLLRTLLMSSAIKGE